MMRNYRPSRTDKQPHSPTTQTMTNRRSRLCITWLALRILSEADGFVSSTISSCKRRRHVLPSSQSTRRLAPSFPAGLHAQRKSLYYSEEDEDENENDGTDFYDSPNVRATDRGNDLQKRLQRPPVEAPLQRRRPLQPPRTEYQRNPYSYDSYDAYEIYDDDQDDDPEEYNDDYNEEFDADPSVAATGNFWSNPVPATEPRPVLTRKPKESFKSPREGSSAGRRPAVNQRRRDSSAPAASRRRQRTTTANASTFRSGTPPPPAPVRDLYNKLFWYGIQDDADEPGAMDEADATMFGGTKGKFNGLAYLQAGEDQDQGYDSRRQRRVNRRRQVDIDDDWEEGLYGRAEPKKWWGPVTPPDDRPNPAWNANARPRRRNGRTAQRDWTSDTVSSWFGKEEQELGDGDGDNDDEPVNARSKRRRQRSDSASSPSPLFSALDSFLGLNRKSLQERADWYDSQMGTAKRPKKRRPQQTRPGYAYPLDDDTFAPEDRLDEMVVDVDPIPVDGEPPAEPVRDEAESKGDGESDDNGLSWQERVLAVERVPPAGIPAWGPSGELDMDARTKSILDALDDIMNAKQRLKDQEKLVELATEDVAILRVDAQLNQKRLARASRNVKVIQSEMRRLELKVQEASRKLRLAKSRLMRAKEELVDLEARHWAVLRCYDSDKVAANLADAFRELEESEPAVKLYVESTETAIESEMTSDSSTDAI